jgi:uncharacterized protein (TIGR02001 family)
MQPTHSAITADNAVSTIVSFDSGEPARVLLDVPEQTVAAARLILVSARAETKDVAEPAPPQSDGEGFSSNIALVSDYRVAGVSSSDRAVALQGGVDFDGPSGWSIGAWTSTIERTAGSNFELDLYGAKAFEFGDTELSIGAVLIVLPGGENASVGLVDASLSSPLGPVDATLSARYVWPQGNLDDQDDLYVSLNGKTPIGSLAGADLTLGASVGYERGAFAVEETKTDWSVSLTANVGGVDVGLSYVDTDLRDNNGAPGLILSLTRTF